VAQQQDWRPSKTSAHQYARQQELLAAPTCSRLRRDRIPSVVFCSLTDSASLDPYLCRTDIATMSPVCRRARKRRERKRRTSGSTAYISLCYSPSPSETGTGWHALPPVGGYLLLGSVDELPCWLSTAATYSAAPTARTGK
jgi:hypothetical protein